MLGKFIEKYIMCNIYTHIDIHIYNETIWGYNAFLKSYRLRRSQAYNKPSPTGQGC